jgi:hypothetical protein
MFSTNSELEGRQFWRQHAIDTASEARWYLGDVKEATRVYHLEGCIHFRTQEPYRVPEWVVVRKPSVW